MASACNQPSGEDVLRLGIPAQGAARAGKAYFLGQSEPVELRTWLGAVLSRLGLPAPRRRVPLALAYAAGWMCEGAWTLALRTSDPPMTRFLARQLARSHTYDLAPARRDFDYEELVSLDAATERIVLDLSTRISAGALAGE